MMAKSIAAEADVTITYLCRDDCRNIRSKVHSRWVRVITSLLIIEDIDTVGTVSRKFNDHPILGEYLQAMDGMEKMMVSLF